MSRLLPLSLKRKRILHPLGSSLSRQLPYRAITTTIVDDAFQRNQVKIEQLAASVSSGTLDLTKDAFKQQKQECNISGLSPRKQLSRRNVYSNRELDLGTISAIGFDYDYTLASYKTALQHFIYDEAKKYLLTESCYPKQLADLAFEKEFAVRGLTFDLKTGILSKLSFFQRVTSGRAYRGRQLVPHDELVQAYGRNLHMSRAYMDASCVWVNDLFSLSEACLLSDVVQLALEVGINFDPYALQQDVQTAISHVHVSGIMHRAVAKDPAFYLHANPALKVLLTQWRDAGKQLFLLTNSSFPFVNAGMRYIVDDEYWQELFDIVITAAGKPKFFTQDTPFRSLSKDCSFTTWHPVTGADLDQVLVQGSVERLSNLAGWENENVLYFGDHLHSDLVEPRRTRGWYTGAIIRELEREFQVQQSDEYRHLLSTIFRVEDLLRNVQEEYDAIEGYNVNDDALQELLDSLESTRMELYTGLGSLFNRHFGSIFRSLDDPSAYALALYKGCDVYTTRIENFLDYSPNHRFYPVHTDHLPHEKFYPSHWQHN